MSITYANMRVILDSIIEDPDFMSLSTSAQGNSDKTTLVDISLSRYKDGYFKSFYVWHTVAAEERMVDVFMKTSGTLKWHEAVTTQVAASTTYKLWRYSDAMKLSQINRALRYAFPRFYNPVKDETLFGQNLYGEPDEEYNKFIYDIPSGFEGYPDQIWIKPAYIGEHTGSDGAAALTDSNAIWKVSELVGLTVYNKTDGSSGTITANTLTTITASLSGGSNDDWDDDDEYIVQNPEYEPTRLTAYTILDPAGSTKQFYADIAEDNLITLIGKGRLTEFTNEASTTELTDAQAEVVCQKAAANIYMMLANKVDTKYRDKFLDMALTAEALYDGKSRKDAMASLGHPVLDWSWSIGAET